MTLVSISNISYCFVFLFLLYLGVVQKLILQLQLQNMEDGVLGTSESIDRINETTALVS